MNTKLTRRTALFASAVTPFAAAGLVGAGPAVAQDTQDEDSASRTPPPAVAPYRRYAIGEMTVTTLLAGTKTLPEPHGTFGLNASDGEFTALSEENFLPSDVALNGFTPVMVETDDAVVLFDTGLDAAGITAALKAAGKSPDDITHVVITHMHGDHIGGLMSDGTPTFSNAAYFTGRVEWDHWAGAGNEGFDTKVRPLEQEFTFLTGDDEVLPGIRAVEAFGHTPGMLAFWLSSGDAQLALTADTANHYVWSLQRPEWEVRFDMDKQAAIETRKKILKQIAQAKIPFIGYHMPFPGIGFLQTKDEGYRFVPASYQFDLKDA